MSEDFKQVGGWKEAHSVREVGQFMQVLANVMRSLDFFLRAMRSLWVVSNQVVIFSSWLWVVGEQEVSGVRKLLQ